MTLYTSPTYFIFYFSITQKYDTNEICVLILLSDFIYTQDQLLLHVVDPTWALASRKQNYMSRGNN